MIKLTFADSIIIIVSGFFVISLYYFFWIAGGEAQEVEIFINGEKRYVYNLAEDREVQVEGRLGSSLLKITDGKVRFLQSSCSTQYCVRSGWHEHAGGFAACLPNGVSVHLTGVDKLYDAINF